MSAQLFLTVVKNKVITLDKRWLVLCLLLMVSLIYWLDEYTGQLTFFAPFYIFPVAMSASLLSRRWTIFFVSLCSLARVQVFSQSFPVGSFALMVFDIAQSFLLFSTVAILAIAIQRISRRQSRYADFLETHLRHLRRQKRIKASIRRALPEDADEIVEVAVCGARSGGLSEELSNTVLQKTLAKAFRQGIVEGQTIRDVWIGGKQKVSVEFWVSIINGRVAGFFMLYGLDSMNGSERELHAMVVKDDYLGLGIGSAMTDFFCMHFKNRRLFAACKPDSKMMKMLTRRGFAFFCSTDNEYIIIERLN
ncbi:GNAT family N-acetyltransferase [Undibacterium sp. Ji49W]|uniref:GNAT family N-acetyltransferase n=1 Tax=Undibacterium sp. Ji49W TaxID=3413040 RepID=UPI003BF102EF